MAARNPADLRVRDADDPGQARDLAFRLGIEIAAESGHAAQSTFETLSRSSAKCLNGPRHARTGRVQYARMGKQKRRRRRKDPAPEFQRVVAMMEELDITNVELANAIGVAPATVTRILNGDKQWSRDFLQKLEKYFGKKAFQLMAPPDSIYATAWDEASPAAREEIARYARYVIEREKKAG